MILTQEEIQKLSGDCMAILLRLSEDDRLNIMYNFCQHCGKYQSPITCQCWNDE